MASNQTGIAIVIKAFLVTGKTLDEQFAALSIVKAAHESGDYTDLLKAATVDEVKTEQKTRRMPDAPSEPAPAPAQSNDPAEPAAEGQVPVEQPAVDVEVEVDDTDVPEFLKDKKKKTA